MNNKFIIIYITHKNLKEAKRVVGTLIDRKLIACGNLFTVESLYLWKGKIENGKEIVSIVKTRKENWLKVKKEVEKIHPYEIPCIMKIDVETNDIFARWIKNSTKK